VKNGESIHVGSALKNAEWRNEEPQSKRLAQNVKK